MILSLQVADEFGLVNLRVLSRSFLPLPPRLENSNGLRLCFVLLTGCVRVLFPYFSSSVTGRVTVTGFSSFLPWLKALFP